MRKVIIVFVLVVVVILALVASSGVFLVVNDLQHADAIVVLAGEMKARPERGLELVAQHYAPRMLLDVPANEVIYDRPLTDIAQQFLQNAGGGKSASICPIYGLSTKTETQDVSRCLGGLGVHRILLVTSAYHTRRARDIFRHQLHGYEIFVTPATDPQQFGTHWWQHRQWAKTSFDEWEKLMWWELIDRWR